MGRKLAVILIALVGCAQTPKPQPTPAPDPLEYALYDGKTGKKIDVAALITRAREADFFAFGELHRHPAGSLLQKELLTALVDGLVGAVKSSDLALVAAVSSGD